MSSLLRIASQEHDHAHDHCSATVKLNVQSAGQGQLAPQTFRGRAAVITLGCAKNQVDSEVMIGVLRNSGYEIVNEIDRADVAVVNTCGFLQSAVEESIDCILEVGEYKKKGQLRRLIVAGCMVERYRAEVEKSLPEVDRFISVNEVLSVADAANGKESDAVGELLADAARPYFLYDEKTPREIGARGFSAYVKVSEGCNRPCTFCIIPKIRGAMRSRTIDSVVKEVRALASQGVREVNLVAQDLTSYGLDWKEEAKGGSRLAALLRALDGASVMPWIRLLYAYPVGIDDELIDSIMSLPSVCKYLDFPLQHSSEAVLRAMRRPLGKFSARRIVEYLHTRAPSLDLRTTFIVGFPGETEADVDDLESFIREGHFSTLGVFSYSPEEGTPAFSMEHQISANEKEARRERLMLAQQEVMAERYQRYLGQKLEVLVEGAHPESDLILSGRTRFQAPEVDGTVIINDVHSAHREVAPGTLGLVEITEIAGYDLIGTFIPTA